MNMINFHQNFFQHKSAMMIRFLETDCNAMKLIN